MAIPAFAAVSGDANGSGALDRGDLSTLTGFLFTEQAVIDPAADMNGDGIINAIDLTLLNRALMNASAGTETPAAGNRYVTQISYASASVTLKNAAGETVSAADAENVRVENGTTVTVIAPTSDGTTDFGDINLDGECQNGQIRVDVDKEAYPDGAVGLDLCGLTLSNAQDSPVYISQIADECVITAKKDTVNTISDGTDYTNADESAGAIYSLDDLKFKGKGSLIVNGNAGDAIVGKDDIKIWNGSLTVHAADDGIQAAQEVLLFGGDVSVETYEGADYTSGSTGTGTGGNPFGGQNPRGGFTPPGSETGTGNDLEFSCKGIKAGDSDASLDGSIMLSGGKLTLNTSDDAIHCGGTLTVSGGEITIDTADDALHCDKYLNIGGGTVRINRSYEGVEAMQIRMTAGDVTVYAEDDPFNAAKKGVKNEVDVANDNCIIQIDGGMIHAFVTNEREGDGIDSNGKIVINGGEIYVEGSVSGPDSALDSDGEMLVNGGVVMAIGGLGRGELPEQSSGQNSLYWGNSKTTYAKGSVIALTDGQGNVLLSYTAEQTFKCAVISSDSILTGGKYAITVNGNQVAEFTVSAALTTQGDIGSSGGPGGPGGRTQ
ncbi:MAG: carbohydrate-binding domain-containing protein [Oscillospiraceae bacterium]|nr:carbohydrate-binding domain-containing protein [Oscillospiraceae bacterium]